MNGWINGGRDNGWRNGKPEWIKGWMMDARINDQGSFGMNSHTKVCVCVCVFLPWGGGGARVRGQGLEWERVHFALCVFVHFERILCVFMHFERIWVLWARDWAPGKASRLFFVCLFAIPFDFCLSFFLIFLLLFFPLFLFCLFCFTYIILHRNSHIPILSICFGSPQNTLT